MTGNPFKSLVGEAGIEPTTPGLEGRCSIRLSYSPEIALNSLIKKDISRSNQYSRSHIFCSMTALFIPGSPPVIPLKFSR